MTDIVLLNLRISMWGISRVLPDRQYEVDADRALVRATKKILECPEYEYLLQLKRGITRRLRTLALPGEILRAGVYPISVGMVEAVEKTLEDFSVRWGVGVVNGPTHGSEPHMPFGGLRHSGNGLRDAGTEALDVYSDWKAVVVNFDPSAV